MQHVENLRDGEEDLVFVDVHRVLRRAAPLSARTRSDVRQVVGDRDLFQRVVDLHAVLVEGEPNEFAAILRVPARTHAHFEVLQVDAELHGRVEHVILDLSQSLSE